MSFTRAGGGSKISVFKKKYKEKYSVSLTPFLLIYTIFYDIFSRLFTDDEESDRDGG